VKATLTKPVLVLQQDTGVTEVLPVGAEVEFTNTARVDGVMIIEWNHHCFSLFREDLLDACTIDDAGRLGWY
jgi:hypothetical protein